MKWYGKGIDGKDYIGTLQTIGTTRYIVDFKGAHEIIYNSAKLL